MTQTEHKQKLLDAVNEYGNAWLDPASPHYPAALQAARELAKEGKLIIQGDRLQRVAA